MGTLVHMPSTKNSVHHLRKIPLFSDCSTKEIGLIIKNSSERTVKPGTVIIEQGRVGREGYVVLEGTATVKRNNKRVGSVGPGSVVGELSLLDNGPRTATVVADTEVKLLVVSDRALRAAIDNIPSISRKLLKALATRVRELDRAHYG